MRALLPRNPEVLERRAKDLLHRLRQRDTFALKRYYSIDSSADTFHPTLADAQYIIAREFGYNSWQQMMESLHNNANSKAASLVRKCN